MTIFENMQISQLTTMRLGGNARYVIEVTTPEEVVDAYNFAAEKNLPVFVLGGGANTIGRDEGFDGVIIVNKITGLELSGNHIRAMGGENWDNVVAAACERELCGIEGLSKIPGTAGAAPVQNIGAYGQEISQVLENVEVYDTVTHDFKTLSKDDLQFSYRKSILNTTCRGRYFVIAINLILNNNLMQRPFYASIEKYISDNNITDFSASSIRKIVSKIRADKLPDPATIPSSGSFFKNVYLTDSEADLAESKGIPVYRSKNSNKINSGWLIEKAGLSGALIHGMHVNPKAALVLINESAKSYADLAAARAEIIETIKEKYGYTLEQEPVEIL